MNDGTRKMGASDEELLRDLPSTFRSSWEILLLARFPALRGGVSRDPDSLVAEGKANRSRTSTGQTETRSGAHNARRSGLSTRDPLGSERAMVLKKRMDRKLRAIAREIRDALEGGVDKPRNELRRCTRCRTFGEGDWLYCPRDGAPMEQMD